MNFGVLTIAKNWVEGADETCERLVATHAHIDAERLIAAFDCGLRLLGREMAIAKLQK